MQAQILIGIDNPIIKNHKVYGQEILPGLAYIDMLYQMFRENGYDYTKLELCNLAIYNPLIVGKDYSVLLSIQCFESKKGQWEIRIEGKEQHSESVEAVKKLYITAQMHSIDSVVFNETLDLNIRQPDMGESIDLDQVYKIYRSHDLVHTDFIKGEGRVFDTDGSKIVDIFIGKEALSTATNFMFHPTLIDGSAVGLWQVFDSLVKEEERVFIPLLYESFRASELLQKHCITRVLASSVRRKKDLLYKTLEFFNEQGQKVAELRNLVIKLVREEGLINPDRKQISQMDKACMPIKTPPAQQIAFSEEGMVAAEALMRQLMSDKLRIPANQINTKVGYYEMGLDSPGLLEVVSAIEAKIGSTLSPTLLFEYTTISELAEYLSQTYPHIFEQDKSEEVSNTSIEINNFESTLSPLSEVMNDKDQSESESEGMDIAVIGMSGRYPGAKNLQELWENLKEGKDLVTEIPKSRWDWKQLEEIKSPSGKSMLKWGGFIDNPDCFDPQFFRISPREAELTDPQERLFLETCWEAIEDAGYTPENLVQARGQNKRRQVGVFAGVMHKDYTLIEAEAVAKGQAFVLSLNCAQIANRVSYFCNFHGPSMAVDTVCSSSLTALHLALESIRHGECEVALAGGVNLSLHPIKYLSVGMIDMHSSDGYCHTFGKGGDGYVSGEGIGSVLLKPLHKAVQDKDHIYAVIKGSTINHVGTVSGMTVPSPVAQGDMIVKCMEKTGINPRTISYVEAHGTGTSLGDPIELQGLTKAYRNFTQDTQFCSIGSIKSNVGHAESAAGISGLHKVILQLYHKTLVPSLHSEELNPYLDLKNSPFYVQHETEEWKQPVIIENGMEVTYPRRAGLSSFGATGSNGHVILEEYIPRQEQQTAHKSQLEKDDACIIPLSAKNEERLKEYAIRLLEFLRGSGRSKKQEKSKAESKKAIIQALEARIRSILSSIIQVGEEVLEADQEWSEYGVEAVHIAQVKEKMQEELNIGINSKILNQTSSVASVAAYIANNHSEELEANTSLLLSNQTVPKEEEQEEGIKTDECIKEINLSELAYTLQVGREAMEARVAFVATKLSELTLKLRAFINGDKIVENCWRGHVKHNREAIELLGCDRDSLELVHKWILKGNVKKIAELWAKGYAMDWELFYRHTKPQRISLPTYPFAMERYWVPDMEGNSIRTTSTVVSSSIHPLLHKNTSDFYEQRFSSVFTGKEFFLSDHVISGQKVLPGVAYLEMARAAATQAAGMIAEAENRIKLRNIVWVRPIIVGDQPTHIHIGLYPKDDGEIDFEIYGHSHSDAESVVYSQGRAVINRALEAPRLNLEDLREQYGQSTLSANQCYEMFRTMGLEYGAGHKGIEKMHLGKNGVLVELSLPSSVSATLKEFVLHPSLMDSALQATIALEIDPEKAATSIIKNDLKPSMPFELQEVEIFKGCSSKMWAFARYSEGSGKKDKVQRSDIDLCDESGKVCVRMKGFSVRNLEAKLETEGAAGAVSAQGPLEPLVGNIMMTPVWDEVPIKEGKAFPAQEDNVVIIGTAEDNVNAVKAQYSKAHVLEVKPFDTTEDIERKLLELGTIDHIVWIAPNHSIKSITQDSIVEEQDIGVLQVLRIVKAVINLGYAEKNIGWSIITLHAQPINDNDLVNPTHVSVHGLVGSMAKEHTNWKIRLMDIQSNCDWPISQMFSLPIDRRAKPFVYRDGKWYCRQLLPIEYSCENKTAYRTEGVYVIIGGAGDIGQIWTEYMIRTYNAKIVWIGRREMDGTIAAKLDKLKKIGYAPVYIAADATNKASMERAYKKIKKLYTQIHGVVHSALTLRDQVLAETNEQKFKGVLSTKVNVSVVMAQVFQKEKLDFVLFFSSIISFIKNHGQSDYAAGCTFKDAFAHQLSRHWSCAVKVMNWGFWYKEESASPETYQIYLKLTEIGMGANEPAYAMKALEKLLSGPLHQIALLKTLKPLPVEGLSLEEQVAVDKNGNIVRQKRCNKSNESAVKQIVSNKAVDLGSSQHKTVVTQVVEINRELLKERSTIFLKELVGGILKIQCNKIDSSEPLGKYGIDSIVIIQLVNALRKVMDNINSTLFFEYQTIDALVDYFIENRHDSLIKLLGLEENESCDAVLEDCALDEDNKTSHTNISNSTFKRSRHFVQLHNLEAGKAEDKAPAIQDIAIIGLSGRYAGANNVNELWNNLKQGKNCITEIPADRWDWKKYFDEEKGKKGKMYTKWGGFIKDIDKFDPLFFQISPAEAQKMDPQERLFLQSAYESIQDAGYTPANLCNTRKIGVFAGAMYGQYPTGAKYWSIANRVSYLFNFQGPSLCIDTACSSALTAIHLALENLYNGTCECAIAGGVNLVVSPEHYLGLSEMTMLSPGSKCKAFGEMADGFVDGEGVGSVVLKPLHKAVLDGDHIYGVIKGSMLNAAGRTNGYTVPNPSVQSELVSQALKRAKVNARSVSYLEAHGTGTVLGDPIEISGLTKAFEKHTQDKQFCAIGSIKSNIGHCESAAGIAALTKVLLQLKHGQLVPSLHSSIPNPNIDFSSTPFVVQQELTEWKRPLIDLSGETKEYPRLAGISSFGAGGSNAHLIIEEYIVANEVNNKITVNANNPAIVILSAKNEEGLKNQAERLLFAIKEHQLSDTDLEDMAYTLQVGREAMEERLAIIAASMKALEEKLKHFIEGKQNISELYKGQVKNDKETMAILAADEDMEQTVLAWLSKGRYGKLLELWVKGLSFDWNILHRGVKPRRISLPTYPFARESYWMEDARGETRPMSMARGPVSTTFIHPLLQQNTSDLFEQRYTTTFTGQEFFLTDHVIKGQHVLPGVAYLEMARAAVEVGAIAGKRGIRLKNVVWIYPMTVDDRPVEAHIGLYPEDNGDISFEIYSGSENGSIERIVHSQGSAVLTKGLNAPTIEFKALKEMCSQGLLEASQCYEAFKIMGIEYGPGHMGLDEVYMGSGQVLAKLSLPSSVSHTAHQFILHPSIMDSALQTSIGLMIASGNLKPALPFALEELEVFGACTSEMWAFVRYSEESMTDNKVQKLDIDLFDETETVCVRLKGFSIRAVEGEFDNERVDQNYPSMVLRPYWKEQTIDARTKAEVHSYTMHQVVLCEPRKALVEEIESKSKGICCLALQTENKGIEERFENYAVQVFEKIQSILRDKPEGEVLIQVVVPNQGEQQLFSGITGLLRTVRLENPKIISQLIEVDSCETSEEITMKLKENALCQFNHHIKYNGGKRFVMSWKEIEACGERESLPFKDGGTYLITGGMGSLGYIFAKEIVNKVSGIALILTGRSMLDEGRKNQLEELQASGARIEYRQVDVTDSKAALDLVHDICEDFGSLDGIIHTAGIAHDNFILRKSSDEFIEVMAPKVKGMVNLDLATRDLDLDFFVLFSSIAGAAGNSGQADYSTANAFMDAYASYRNALVELKERKGQTLSINWPLWRDGGIHVDEEIEKTMMKNYGTVPMKTSTGIQALYKGLASKKNQVMVMEGNVERFYSAISEQQSSTEDLKASSDIYESKEILEALQEGFMDKASDYFKNLLSSVINLPASRIEIDAPMEKYGIDSIMIMNLTNQLEKTFGSLSKTLFFEYQNIKELTEYFIKSHTDKLKGLLGFQEIEKKKTTKEVAFAQQPMMQAVSSIRRARFSASKVEVKEKENNPLDIAIIGVSGRYPGAENLQEFWKNLKDGRDCITEIPKERWDNSLYFGSDKSKSGKTYSKWGGFLKDVDKFDPRFFNISPREAEMLDPQERLFLECVYETLEDAGYTREALNSNESLGFGGNVGVYVGVMYEEYQLYGVNETLKGRPIALGGSAASIANRVSYFCNFHGPSLAVDTMCSSSLTTLHLACRDLQRGDCEMAIAGGVNVSIHPNKYLVLAQGNLTSSKGRCESFGAGGDGYVAGEGVGAVLIKPLSKAIEDGDNIYGVIKGTAINHGGKTNGYKVPNPNSMASVIEKGFSEAGIDPRRMGYIEGHGTGTFLGDPIEITGLSKAFGEYTKDKQFCAIGSVKSNIGHCESAAGIAGITKILLQLRYGQLVPSLHSKILNPNIDFSNTPFVVQQELAQWKRPIEVVNGQQKECPRLAGILSFGAGGSNALVVIQEYMPRNAQQHKTIITDDKPLIIVLSAKNEERLKEQAKRLLATVKECKMSDENLMDIAYTLQVGREAMEERLGFLAGSLKELEDKLKGFVEGQEGMLQIYKGQIKHNKEALAVIASDEEFGEAIEKWVQRRKYGKLLELWVKGLNFDWNRLYSGERPNRISLPAYPFARERYWVPGSRDAQVVGQAEVVKDHKPIVEPGEIKLEKGSSGKAFDLHEKKRPLVSLNLPDVKSEVKMTRKTGGISLEPLSEVKVQLCKPEGKGKPLISLQQVNVTLTNPDSITASQTVDYVKVAEAENLIDELAKSLAEALYMQQDEIDLDEKFIDMGLDSITAVEWIQVINKKYNVNVSAIKVNDYPTVHEFAEYLEKELSKRESQSERVGSELSPLASFEEIINKVQSGELDIEKADHILRELNISEISEQEKSFPDKEIGEVSEWVQVKTADKSAMNEIEKSIGVRKEELMNELAESLAEALYMQQDEIDLDEKFIDMGLDSITGVEWIQGINKKYNVNVSATKVYDYPTVREFAGYLEKELGKLGNQSDRTDSELKPLPSFEDIIQGVQAGLLDIEQANHMLQQLNISEISEQESQEGDNQTVEVSEWVQAETAAVSVVHEVDGGSHTGKEELMDELAESLAEALYMQQDEIDLDEKFIDMGLDSITGVEWIQGINKKYSVNISAIKVNDYPTVREFASYLAKELIK